jgi:hypothetical protein
MMTKWTEEQRAKFKATMAAKKAGGWTNTGKVKKATKKKSQRKIVVKRKAKKAAKVAKPGQYPKAFAKEEGAAPKSHAKGKSDRALLLQIIHNLTKLL